MIMIMLPSRLGVGTLGQRREEPVPLQPKWCLWCSYSWRTSSHPGVRSVPPTWGQSKTRLTHFILRISDVDFRCKWYRTVLGISISSLCLKKTLIVLTPHTKSNSVPVQYVILFLCAASLDLLSLVAWESSTGEWCCVTSYVNIGKCFLENPCFMLLKMISNTQGHVFQDLLTSLDDNGTLCCEIPIKKCNVL